MGGAAEWGQHLPPAGEQSGQAERPVPSGKWVSKWERVNGGGGQGWCGLAGAGTVNRAGEGPCEGEGRSRQSPAHGPASPQG